MAREDRTSLAELDGKGVRAVSGPVRTGPASLSFLLIKNNGFALRRQPGSMFLAGGLIGCWILAATIITASHIRNTPRQFDANRS
jgi:hypothetical protein